MPRPNASSLVHHRFNPKKRPAGQHHYQLGKPAAVFHLEDENGTLTANTKFVNGTTTAGLNPQLANFPNLVYWGEVKYNANTDLLRVVVWRNPHDRNADPHEFHKRGELTPDELTYTLTNDPNYVLTPPTVIGTGPPPADLTLTTTMTPTPVMLVNDDDPCDFTD